MEIILYFLYYITYITYILYNGDDLIQVILYEKKQCLESILIVHLANGKNIHRIIRLLNNNKRDTRADFTQLRTDLARTTGVEFVAGFIIQSLITVYFIESAGAPEVPDPGHRPTLFLRYIRDARSGDYLVPSPQKSKMYRVELVYNTIVCNSRPVVPLLIVAKVVVLMVKARNIYCIYFCK